MSVIDNKPRWRLFSLREFLLRVHTDLLQIERSIDRFCIYGAEQLSAVEQMVLILEDRRFFKHGGVDLKSVCRETLKACLGKRHGGASTIDMQFVRTVTGYRERTIKRKIYEIFLASLIQIRYSKIVILRSYLGCAFLGSHLRGVQSASLRMFNKPAADLNLQEASTIAAMLVYPRPLRPTESWNLRIQRRADYGQRIYISTKQRLEKKPSRKSV